MRIERLEIRNFKQFAEFTLDLHPQFTLLVGDNGTGKTSLLDALAIAAGVWLVNPPDTTLANSGRNILPNEIRVKAVETGDRTQFVECKPVQIAATGQIDDQDNVDWLRQIRQDGVRTVNTEANTALAMIANRFERSRNGANIWFPIIAYYGAGRAWLPSNRRRDTQIQSSVSPSRRWEAFYNCLAERIRIADLQFWFQKGRCWFRV